MNSISPKINIPKFNMLLIFFMSFILLNYIFIGNINYLVYVFLIVIMFRRLLKGEVIKDNIKVNAFLMPLIIISGLYILIRSLSKPGLFIFIGDYSIAILAFLFCLMEYNKYGKIYGEQFLKQLSVVLNILSVTNMYQVIYKKPLLADLLTETAKYQTYNYGTDSFRVVSAFSHPIVCGLFFCLLLVFNFYILKGKNPYLYYTLQMITLINVYFASSRSTWLALLVVFALIYIKWVFSKKIKFRFKMTYARVYFGLWLIIGIIAFLYFGYEQIYHGIINRFGDSLSMNSTDISNLQRTGTVSMINEHMVSNGVFQFLFGNGIGTVTEFMKYHTVYIPGFLTTDNMYLTLFYELGVFSLIGYFSFVIYTLYMFFKSNDWVHEISALCFIFISIEMFFFEGLNWGVVSVLIAFSLLTLILAFKQNNETVPILNEMKKYRKRYKIVW